jgi:uncharacterized protein (TIGR02246 family)
MKTVLSTIALMMTFAGAAFAQDAKSIAEQGNQKWIQAYEAGDAAALTALYSKSAVLLPQGVAEPLIGETNIRKFFDEAVKKPPRHFSLSVAEAKMVGSDNLFEAGTWAAEMPGQNGGTTTHLSGTFLSVLQREGSDWLLRADTWNMMPPPTGK